MFSENLRYWLVLFQPISSKNSTYCSFFSWVTYYLSPFLPFDKLELPVPSFAWNSSAAPSRWSVRSPRIRTRGTDGSGQPGWPPQGSSRIQRQSAVRTWGREEVILASLSSRVAGSGSESDELITQNARHSSFKSKRYRHTVTILICRNFKWFSPREPQWKIS